MKKLIAILLALVLVLSLCACKKAAPDAAPTDTGSTNTTDTTDTTDSTDTTDTTGTTDTTDTTDSTDTTGDATPDNGGNSTNTTPTCTHEWKAATCTAPKTCSKCNATEGSAAGHSWKAATCTAPKTCSVCGATEGSKGSHTFTADCTICGQPNADYVPVDQSSWSYTFQSEGDLIMADYAFYCSGDERGVSIGYDVYKTLEKFGQEYDMTIDEIRAEYADMEMIKTINGVEYIHDGWGMDNWSDRRYKEENGVVTVEFLSLNWDNEDNKIYNVEQTVVMKRTGMAQMTVTSSNYESTPVGTVLTGEYFGS